MEEFKAVTQKKNYSKTSSSLWKYSRDELVNPIKNYDSFKCKANIIVKSASGGNTKEAEFAVPLECLSNFWRALDMPPINCKVNLILIWSKNCVITDSATQNDDTNTDFSLPGIRARPTGVRFEIKDTKTITVSKNII